MDPESRPQAVGALGLGLASPPTRPASPAASRSRPPVIEFLVIAELIACSLTTIML